MHHIDFSFLYFCALTLFDAVYPWFSLFSFLGLCFCFSFNLLASWLRKLEPTGKPPLPLLLPLRVIGLESRNTKRIMRNFISLRLMWAEHKVILDELDPEIRRNFESRGWLPLLDISHPPLAVLIREFYLNLSIHSTSSNIRFVKSWIRGEKYVITPQVVASALGVPLVQQPIYPYDEDPPLDEIMSHITGTSIRWGSNPRITTYELTKLNYLFF